MKFNTQPNKVMLAVVATIGLGACNGNSSNNTSSTTSTAGPDQYAVASYDRNADGTTDGLSVFKFSAVNQTEDLFSDRNRILDEKSDYFSPPGYRYTSVAEEYDIADPASGGFLDYYISRSFTSAKNTYSEMETIASGGDGIVYLDEYNFSNSNLLTSLDSFEDGTLVGTAAVDQQVTSNGNGTTTTTRSYDQNADTTIEDVRTVTVDDVTGNILEKTFDNTPSTADFDKLVYTYDGSNRPIKLQAIDDDGFGNLTYESTSIWDYSVSPATRTHYESTNVDPVLANDNPKWIQTLDSEGRVLSQRQDNDGNGDFTSAFDSQEFYTYNADGKLLTGYSDTNVGDTTVRYSVVNYNSNNQITSLTVYPNAEDIGNDGSVETLNAPSRTETYQWFTSEPTCAQVYNGESPANAPTDCSPEMP